MSTLRSASYALGLLIFASICAGCAVDGPKSAAFDAPVARLDAPGGELLFVSDRGANTIAVFTLPYLYFVRTITAGLDEPSGLCGTPNGDIWVANYGNRRMLRFHPDGKAPSKEIKDTDGYPFACSADGTLAYANKHNVNPTISPMSGPGETWVGKFSYNYPSLNEDLGVAWQNAPPAPGVMGAIDGTNLYIVGKSKNGAFVLGEIRAGSSVIQQIIVKGGTIHDPGMVQWYANGGYLAVGDRHCGTPRSTCVYHIKIKGLHGKITGETTFETHGGNPICDMAQGVIETSGSFSYLDGGDNETPCSGRGASSSVDRWAFPAGGMPVNFAYYTPLTQPFGTAISVP